LQAAAKDGFVSDQTLFPCAKCQFMCTRDHLCMYCQEPLHSFCSVVEGEGHHSQYVCPSCSNHHFAGKEASSDEIAAPAAIGAAVEVGNDDFEQDIGSWQSEERSSDDEDYKPAAESDNEETESEQEKDDSSEHITVGPDVAVPENVEEVGKFVVLCFAFQFNLYFVLIFLFSFLFLR